jgi:hypothetical protein
MHIADRSNAGSAATKAVEVPANLPCGQPAELDLAEVGDQVPTAQGGLHRREELVNCTDGEVGISRHVGVPQRGKIRPFPDVVAHATHRFVPRAAAGD